MFLNKNLWKTKTQKGREALKSSRGKEQRNWNHVLQRRTSEKANEIFHDEFIDEFKNAILISSNTKSFDIGGLCVTMMKNLGTKAIFLLTIFYACLEYHVWSWTELRVVFIGKRNKEMMNALLIDHSQGTLERIHATRIKSHLDVNGLLGNEQEGFRSKRKTTRSPDRLHFMLENDKHSRMPTALLSSWWAEIGRRNGIENQS